MEFLVTNSAGYVSRLPITVRIYDEREEAKLPSIKLTKYLINVEKGTDIDPASYIKALEVNGIVYSKNNDTGLFESEPDELNTEILTIDSSAVTIDASAYDKETSGTYEIIYKVSDAEGDVGVTRLYVVVREDNVRMANEKPGT